MTETARGASLHDLKDQARRRLQKRRDLGAHVMVYLLVNGFLLVIWAVTSDFGFFWPIFPLVGWGIGVVMNAWDVYVAGDITDEQIQREIDRMHHVER